MPSKIDRNADTHERHRRNWQRLVEGSGTNLIVADGTTISTSGGVLHVPDDGITLAKLADISTDQRLIGRDNAGSDEPTLILATGGIVFTGTGGIQTTSFSGDVTKTLGGTVLTLATVNANVGGPFNTFTTNAKGLILSATNNTYTTTTVANDTIWDAKGDLAVATAADTAVRQPVGATGQSKCLVPDSAQTTGINWATLIDIFDQTLMRRSTASNTGATNRIVQTRSQASAVVTNLAKSSEPGNHMAELWASGYYSSATAADTLTFSLDVIGGTAGGTTTSIASVVITMAGTETDVPFLIESGSNWRTSGVSGTATGWLRVTYGGLTSTVSLVVPTTDTTIDTTGTVNRFQLSYKWSTGRVGNSLTAHGYRSIYLSNGRVY